MAAKANAEGRSSPVVRTPPADCYEPWDMSDHERELATKFIRLIQGRIPSKVNPL